MNDEGRVVVAFGSVIEYGELMIKRWGVAVLVFFTLECHGHYLCQEFRSHYRCHECIRFGECSCLGMNEAVG